MHRLHLAGTMISVFRCLPLFGLTVLVVGCSPKPESQPSAAQTVPTTGVVKRQDLTGYRFFNGKLVIPSTAQATVFSPYDTPVVSVTTSVGKYVEHGEPIITLNIPGADDAKSQAKTNSTMAKAALTDQKELSSGPVKVAQQALKDAQAAEKAAQDTVSSGGSADVAAATQARTDAEAALRDAKLQLQQTLEPAKQAATASAAQLQEVKADAAKGIVRAPISGTITTLAAQIGMEAKSKQDLATIIDFGSSRVEATVPPELKDVIVKDARVIIAMSGPSSEPMAGRVVSVKVLPPSAGDQKPDFIAIIEFTKPRSMSQPSTTVRRVGIKTGEVKNAFVVPVEAVISLDGKSIVKIQKGTEWVSTPVVTGLSDGTFVQIKSGVSGGDIVEVPSTPK